jgi:hypothetical protein
MHVMEDRSLMFHTEGRCGRRCVRDGSNQHDAVREDANLRDDVRRYREDVRRCL